MSPSGIEGCFDHAEKLFYFFRFRQDIADQFEVAAFFYATQGRIEIDVENPADLEQLEIVQVFHVFMFTIRFCIRQR